MALVLLSASVERCFVSHMRDFLHWHLHRLAQSDLYQVTTGWTVQGYYVYCTYKLKRLGSWCTEHIRSGHFGYGQTKGMVTMYSKYTAHVSSNGSNFLAVRVFKYWTYKVSKFGYGGTKWMITMYSNYTAHISSNGSHFLMARVLVYWTYKVSKFGYVCTKWIVTMYSKTKYTAHIISNGSHFLTARVFVYWTNKVSKFGYGRTKWMVTIYSKYTAHISSSWS